MFYFGTEFPCKICAKNIHDKDKAVQCDLCELWIHIKAQFFFLTPYQATKTSWLVVLTLIVISHSEKIWKMIIIVHYY